MLLLLCYFYIIIYIQVYIHIFFFYSYQVFTWAILAGYSALFQCACNLPEGSCVGPEAAASGPGTWGPRCLWGHCCGSRLESHVHVVAWSPCIPVPPPCHGLALACLQGHCWSLAPQPCSRATRAMADLTQCQRKQGQVPQVGGPWGAAGTPQRNWVYVAPEPRQENVQFIKIYSTCSIEFIQFSLFTSNPQVTSRS